MAAQSAPQDSPAHSPEHYPGLDGLRGLAILVVLVHHFTPISDRFTVDEQAILWQIFNGGWMGVDLFFVLSGFLITGILLDSRSKPNYLKNFYGRRVLRIFPLYYLAVALCLIWFLPLADPARTESLRSHQAWIWLYGTNLLAIKLGGDVHNLSNVMLHFWSLAVEEHFYMVWPFLILWIPVRRLPHLIAGMFFTAWGLRILAIGMGLPLEVPYLFTLCRMDSLAVGAALSLAYRCAANRRAILAWTRPCGAVGCSVILVLALQTATFSQGKPFALFTCTATALLCGALLMETLLAEKGSFLGTTFDSRFFRFFGKYSYGLYVWHIPVLALVYAQVALPGGEGTHDSALHVIGVIWAILFPLTIAVALLSWHGFEKHFLKLKRYFR